MDEQARNWWEVGLSLGHIKSEVSSWFALSTRDTGRTVGKKLQWEQFAESTLSKTHHAFEDLWEEVGGDVKYEHRGCPG